MIPAALFAILATSRLGAIHAVVFGGFAPASLAQRIEASKPRAIMTASCGIEGAKGALNYKLFVEGAIQKSSFKPEKVIIWQREQLLWEPIVASQGERHWQGLVQEAKQRALRSESVPIKSSEGLYIIYTSGECDLVSRQSCKCVEVEIPLQNMSLHTPNYADPTSPGSTLRLMKVHRDNRSSQRCPP